MWGIINGRKGLPEKWVEPLGDEVTVRKGFIRNLTAPTNLEKLTDKVCAVGEKVLVEFDADVELGDVDDFTAAEDLIHRCSREVRGLWNIPPNRLDFDLVTVKASIVYVDGPALLPDVPNRFTVLVHNTRPEPVSGLISVLVPKEWVLEPSETQRFLLNPREEARFNYRLKAPASRIDTFNRSTVKITVDQKPDVLRLPLNFVGGFRWLVSEVFREPLSLETVFPVEKDAGSMEPGEGWKPVSWPENALEIEPLFKGRPGVIYLRHFIYSPDARDVMLGVPNNNAMKLWLNGVMIHQTKKVLPLRPNYGGDGSNYAKAVLKQGWNHVMVKIFRGEKPIQAHFVASRFKWRSGMADVLRCRFPWE